MRARLLQITDIERIRSLKLAQAERKLQLTLQQSSEVKKKLSSELEMEDVVKRQYETLRVTTFNGDALEASGHILKHRVAEISQLKGRIQQCQCAVMSLQHQFAKLTLACEQAREDLNRCHKQLITIQQQGRVCRQQLKAQRVRRSEADVEELFVQKIYSQRTA